MKIIKLHYDKILLLIVLIILSVCLIFSLTESFDTRTDKSSLPVAAFSISKFDDEKSIELLRESDLIPNDIIRFKNKVNGDIFESTILKVIFPRKSRVTIFLNSKKIIKGRLLNPSDTIFSDNWKKMRNPLAVDTESGVMNVNMRDILRIKGNQKLILSTIPQELSPAELTISTYQEKSGILIDSNRTDKIRWTNNSNDFNSTIYDLFTPPIIYLVNGELTTSLPEKPEQAEKIEAFGLTLVEFEKEKFPLKLSSWIGQTPYFEDLETQISPNSIVNVKNRIEIKIPYKKNLNYRPGLPSLVKTNIEDDDKFFMVEYFTVQDVKDAKTGGSRLVGRALVKDFTSDSKPFEINSQMDEVFTDKFRIHLKLELEGIPNQDVFINDKDIGKILELESRKFEVLNINPNNKTVELTKQIEGKDSKETRILSLKY